MISRETLSIISIFYNEYLNPFKINLPAFLSIFKSFNVNNLNFNNNHIFNFEILVGEVL